MTFFLYPCYLGAFFWHPGFTDLASFFSRVLALFFGGLMAVAVVVGVVGYGTKYVNWLKDLASERVCKK